MPVGGSERSWTRGEELRRTLPVFALAVAVVSVATGRSSLGEIVLAAIPPAAIALWTYRDGVALEVVSLAVVVPVVAAQAGGRHEPLMFEVSLLSFVVAWWARTAAVAVALGLLALAAPVAVGIIQSPEKVNVGIWVLGILFPWMLGRAAVRQGRLEAALDASRRELAAQAMLEERRRIARDVHDFVGHGLAALMLQVTGARHVLRRDPEAAEEALRSAEEVGRRSMQELRRTVALLRDDTDAAVPPPVPTAAEIGALVDDARSAGLNVEVRFAGDLERVTAAAGTAVYRIAQEALANAARHAPRARTVLSVDVSGDDVSLVAETAGPVPRAADDERAGRSHFGVIGMRERATALQGVFDAGPSADGGWRVSCRIPLSEREGAAT